MRDELRTDMTGDNCLEESVLSILHYFAVTVAM